VAAADVPGADAIWPVGVVRWNTVVKGWTMKTFRGVSRKLLLVFAFIALTGAGAAGAAESNEPNQAGDLSLDLSKLDVSTVQEILTKIYTLLAEYGLKILGSVVIFLVGRWVAGVLSRLAGKGLTKAKVDETLVRFVQSLCYLGLLTFVIVASLSNMGVQTTSFVAVVGAAGLAIGLALQGSLANFASGVLMLIFKPIRVGDFVEAGGVKGSVKEVGIFNTTLNSPDNVRIIVPNAQITSSHISNYTVNGTRRVDLVVGVSYEDDLKKAKQVIEDVLRGEERLLPEPAAVVAVSAMAESSVNLVVRPWVKVADYWPVYFALTERIKVALEDNGLTIPFPQRDVHLKNGQLVSSAK
jgi:small conductance mechanosensitive channel